MSIYLYNTLKRKKELFVPLDPNRITMYVCGPTVYNYVHIGNARPVVVFDVLYRLLKHCYPEVVYARNITDVDDKINKAAAENGEPIRALAERFAAAYHEDMARLNALTPTLEPYATDNIAAMIDIIEALISKEHAYVSSGHVLFDVSSMKDYGKLSGRKLEDMLAGASERVEEADYKRNQHDFVLWKPSTDEQPGWDSPWGRGRPGWHIECTAMINAHLGKTIDIHGGGQDLIFPHHENEIAQGCCAHGGADYVRYWLHNGYITTNNEKMSKSLGNFFTVRDVLKECHGEVARYALLSAHYRSPLDWSPEAVQTAKSGLDRLYNALESAKLTEAQVAEAQETADAKEVVDALSDDINTPVAISQLHHYAKQINTHDSLNDKQRYASMLIKGANLLGLLTCDAEGWFKQGSSEANLSDAQIDALLIERSEARKNKDFARSDEIRDQLTAEGIKILDTPDGAKWQRA